MKDINAIRLQILKEIKSIHRFFNMMEAGVKSRNPEKIDAAYMFLKCLVYHMNEGDLTPDAINLASHIWGDHYKKLAKESIIKQL